MDTTHGVGLDNRENGRPGWKCTQCKYRGRDVIFSDQPPQHQAPFHNVCRGYQSRWQCSVVAVIISVLVVNILNYLPLTSQSKCVTEPRFDPGFSDSKGWPFPCIPTISYSKDCVFNWWVILRVEALVILLLLRLAEPQCLEKVRG